MSADFAIGCDQEIRKSWSNKSENLIWLEKNYTLIKDDDWWGIKKTKCKTRTLGKQGLLLLWA